MATLNKVMLIGRLGKDPELKYVGDGIAKSSFTLATDDSYKDASGNKVERTDWHNIVTWRNVAEVVNKFLKKGSLVYLEGKIGTRSYDDKDGNKKYITEVTAFRMQMLDAKKSSESGAAVEEPATSFDEVKDSADDLPF